MENLIRPKELKNKLGIAMSTLYLRMKEPDFPPKIKLGKGNAVAFRESEIEAWLDSNTEKKPEAV